MNIINPKYEDNSCCGLYPLIAGNNIFCPEYGLAWQYTYDEIIIENMKIKFNIEGDICSYIAIIINKDQDIFIESIRLGEETENIPYNFYNKIKLDNKIIFIYSIKKVYSMTFRRCKYHNIIFNKPYIGNINILYNTIFLQSEIRRDITKYKNKYLNYQTTLSYSITLPMKLINNEYVSRYRHSDNDIAYLNAIIFNKKPKNLTININGHISIIDDNILEVIKCTAKSEKYLFYTTCTNHLGNSVINLKRIDLFIITLYSNDPEPFTLDFETYDEYLSEH